MEIGHWFDQSLLRWKRASVHCTMDKTFCAENIVPPYAQSHWAECLVSRRCLWLLMSWSVNWEQLCFWGWFRFGSSRSTSPLPSPPHTDIFLLRWGEAWGPRRWPRNGQHGVYLWPLPGFDHRPKDELQCVRWLWPLLWMLCSKEIFLWVCLRCPLIL